MCKYNLCLTFIISYIYCTEFHFTNLYSVIKIKQNLNLVPCFAFTLLSQYFKSYSNWGPKATNNDIMYRSHSQ